MHLKCNKKVYRRKQKADETHTVQKVPVLTSVLSFSNSIAVNGGIHRYHIESFQRIDTLLQAAGKMSNQTDFLLPTRVSNSSRSYDIITSQSLYISTEAEGSCGGIHIVKCMTWFMANISVITVSETKTDSASIFSVAQIKKGEIIPSPQYHRIAVLINQTGVIVAG